MMRAKLALGALALGLTGLLAACGPGNTLAVGKGSEDFRLKTVEANLQKVQEDIKTLASHQQQNDGRLVEVHKKLAELVSTLEAQGVKMPAGASKGSALGVGFAHPEAAAAPPAPATPADAAQNQGEKREAGVAQQAAAQSPPSPGLPASAAPTGHVTGPPPGMPGGLPPAPMPHGAAKLAQPPAAEPRNRRAMGRVGPAEGSVPATPEAAIAADRSEAAAGPKAAAAPVPPAPVPPAPPTPAAAPTPPSPAATASVPGAKADEAPAAAKPVSPVSGNAETATPSQKAEYNKALQLAINGRNAEAKAAFDQFLVGNPDSPLTPNALYWVGEGAFARGEYQTAIADFEKVAKGWPGHHKAADSLYKMAMAQEKAGDAAAARGTLERYLKDYPNAELAGIARQKLQALPK